MRIRVLYSAGANQIDETFESSNAVGIVKAMQAAAARRANFAARILISALSPDAFSREVVSRYNQHFGKSLALPTNSDEFLALGLREGILIDLNQQ